MKIKNTLRNLIVLIVGLISFSGFADAFRMIHVEDLNKMMKAKGTQVVVFDANSTETRKTDGIIPGAKLLSSFDEYNTAKELPANKSTSLVFYCANTRCTASHTAAKRAMDAGFKDVSVMSDGIQGWKKSGQMTAQP